jgi:hypothetical protein
MDPVGRQLSHIAQSEPGCGEKGGRRTVYGDRYGGHAGHGSSGTRAPRCDMSPARAAAARAETRAFRRGGISALEGDGRPAFRDPLHAVTAGPRPSERASAMAGM